MWSGVLTSCGRAFLSLTRRLEVGPILLLWLLQSLPFKHTRSFSWQSGEVVKWWTPATARCVCAHMRVLCAIHAGPPYLTGGEHTVKALRQRGEEKKSVTGSEALEEAGRKWEASWSREKCNECNFTELIPASPSALGLSEILSVRQ